MLQQIFASTNIQKKRKTFQCERIKNIFFCFFFLYVSLCFSLSTHSLHLWRAQQDNIILASGRKIKVQSIIKYTQFFILLQTSICSDLGNWKKNTYSIDFSLVYFGNHVFAFPQFFIVFHSRLSPIYTYLSNNPRPYNKCLTLISAWTTT